MGGLSDFGRIQNKILFHLLNILIRPNRNPDPRSILCMNCTSPIFFLHCCTLCCLPNQIFRPSSGPVQQSLHAITGMFKITSLMNPLKATRVSFFRSSTAFGFGKSLVSISSVLKLIRQTTCLIQVHGTQC